jgi:AcrR family transcriptional regulator
MDLKVPIVQKARRPFSQRGVISTGIQDIIESTDISQGKFSNHFTSKIALFFIALKVWITRGVITEFGKKI